MSGLLVEQAGLATVQDLGRPGLGPVGISAGGAGDRYAARTANVLVGNPPGVPLIEITATGFTARAQGHLLIAVTGAAEEVTIDGRAVPVWELLALHEGELLSIAAPARGIRTYLAVHGGVEADRILGSVAPDPFLGLANAVSAGEVIASGRSLARLDHPHLRIPIFRLGATPPPWPRPVAITPGPDAGEFPRGLAVLTRSPYVVAPQSDAIGLRLDGAVPQRATSTEILSRGVPVGAVEIPPSGGVIALLRRRLITAGYPVVAVATTIGVDALAQARPGAELTFRLTTVADAMVATRRQAADLDALAARVSRVLDALGVDAFDGKLPT